jgi:hypothetical protein
MNKRALVVAHGGDVDGIASAAMFKNLLSSKYSIEFIFVIYSMQEEIFEKISQRKDLAEFEVFIVDLSLNDYLAAEVGNEKSIIERIAKRAKRVLWIDHHFGSKKHRKLLNSLGVDVFIGHDNNKCAANLIYNLYFQGDKYFGRLSSIAQISDYPDGLKDEISRVGEDLNKIISLYLFESRRDALKYLAVTLSSGKDWYNNGKYSSEFKKALASSQEHQKKALVQLKESIEIIDIAGRKIMMGFGQGILPDKDTIAEVMKQDEEKADCYIITFGTPINNALVLRGPKSSFTVKNFCSFMKGGGREYGSGCEIGGFSFKFNVTDESYKKTKEITVKGLEEFLKK